MSNISVDEYVRTKIRPEQQEIVAMLRKLMGELAPNAKEEISYGIPAWKGKRISLVRNQKCPSRPFGARKAV